MTPEKLRYAQSLMADRDHLIPEISCKLGDLVFLSQILSRNSPSAVVSLKLLFANPPGISSNFSGVPIGYCETIQSSFVGERVV